MKTGYVPAPGDVVWLQFDPQAGHEQGGHRPALVLSPAGYNAARGMMVCCPMTSRIKGYRFEILVSEAPPSVVLADQVKNLDWRVRGAVYKDAVSQEVLATVRAKLRPLLGL